MPIILKPRTFVTKKIQSNIIWIEKNKASLILCPFEVVTFKRGCTMQSFIVRKKDHVPLAPSQCSSSKLVVNSRENKSKVGDTFCLLKLSTHAMCLDILQLHTSFSLFL